MTRSAQDIPDELHVLAGEYVLGALDTAEMRSVRRQAMVDPALADAIAGWERRLAPMTQAVPPLPPPDALWARIEHAVAPAPDESDDAAPPRQLPRLVPVAQQSEPRRRAPPPPPRVWPWQLATAASFALAASVAGAVLMPTLALRLGVPVLGERFAPVVAVLMPADRSAAGSRGDARPDDPSAQMASAVNPQRFLGEARPDGGTTPAPASGDGRISGFLVEARPDGTLLLAALAQVDVPAGKALELWIQPPGAAAAKSLGVLPAAGHRMILPAMPPAGTALMVSLEPAGGSPTGAPTGPVIYAGKLGQMRS